MDRTKFIPENKQKVKIESGEGFCWNCSIKLGEVRHGNLISPTIVLINRTNFRCFGCRKKNLFEPERK